MYDRNRMNTSVTLVDKRHLKIHESEKDNFKNISDVEEILEEDNNHENSGDPADDSVVIIDIDFDMVQVQEMS